MSISQLCELGKYFIIKVISPLLAIKVSTFHSERREAVDLTLIASTIVA